MNSANPISPFSGSDKEALARLMDFGILTLQDVQRFTMVLTLRGKGATWVDCGRVLDVTSESASQNYKIGCANIEKVRAFDCEIERVRNFSLQNCGDVLDFRCGQLLLKPRTKLSMVSFLDLTFVQFENLSLREFKKSTSLVQLMNTAPGFSLVSKKFLSKNFELIGASQHFPDYFHPAIGQLARSTKQSMSFPTNLSSAPAARTARTSDGYAFTEQPDGTWSDGDMTFDSLVQLVENDPDVLVDGLPVAPSSGDSCQPA